MHVRGPDTYKILSIDGGGIKGLYTATLLARFEREFGPLHQYFDLVCGTSTGGIIALALAAGIPVSRIMSFYKEHGPSIFPYKSKIRRKMNFLKSLGIRSKYSDEKLRKHLTEVFGDLRIKDCHTTVLIPSVNITDGSPYIFKSDHVKPLCRDNERLLTEVALATSAAPTYFPIAEVADCGEQFVDGGLWANNPSLLGIQEALDYYINQSHRRIALLSIATLHEYTKIPHVKRRRRSMFDWGSKLFGLMIDTQSIAVENHIKLLRRSRIVDWDYIRIKGELNVQERGVIDLDLATKKAIDLMIQKGTESGEKWVEDAELKQFFFAKAEQNN